MQQLQGSRVFDDRRFISESQGEWKSETEDGTLMSDLNLLAERNPATMIDPATQSETSMTDSRDLTSILVSRICHDLVSPVGAIVNGVDLVREIGGGDIEAELAMISQSSNRASALLQFYRIAFGAGSNLRAVPIFS